MANAQYEVINMAIGDLDRIRLPQFQRRLVWNKAKKEAFVQTLHEGLPFGAVLVYPESETPGGDLLILDGQQRLSTIRDFQRNKLRYWKPLNVVAYGEFLAAINENLPEEMLLSEKEFDELLSWDDDRLDNWLDDIEPKESRKAVRNAIKEIKGAMDAFVDLKGLQIPAIKFLGSKERIADVFANLNKGGIPLSKYEIFNAAWVDTQISLLSADQSPLQDTILGYVKQHYADMSQDTEFDLEGFSEDELTQKRVITLSELAIALGMFIRDHLKSLVPYSTTAIAEIGYGVLGIAANVDNRQLSHLNKHVDAINQNLQIMLEKIQLICTNLEDMFSKLLKRFKSNKNDQYALGLSTTFKTLSYFAALWDLAPGSKDYMQSLKTSRHTSCLMRLRRLGPRMAINDCSTSIQTTASVRTLTPSIKSSFATPSHIGWQTRPPASNSPRRPLPSLPSMPI